MERQQLVASALVRDGRLFIAQRPAFDAAVRHWPNTEAVLRLEQVVDARSVSLNAYYWGTVIDHVSEETGLTPAETHREMKALHLPPGLHAMRGGSVCDQCARVIDGSTTRLSSREEWRYVENIQCWAAEFLRVVIPDPGLV